MWSENKLQEITQNVFKEILETLRKRRVEDELQVMNSRISSIESQPLEKIFQQDPGEQDDDLSFRLKKSYEEGVAKEQKVGLLILTRVYIHH